MLKALSFKVRVVGLLLSTIWHLSLWKCKGNTIIKGNCTMKKVKHRNRCSRHESTHSSPQLHVRQQHSVYWSWKGNTICHPRICLSGRRTMLGSLFSKKQQTSEKLWKSFVRDTWHLQRKSLLGRVSSSLYQEEGMTKISRRRDRSKSA